MLQNIIGGAITYSLIEKRELVSPTQHTHHHDEHSTHSGELSPVLEERHGHESLLIEFPLPEEEDDAEDTTEDEEENDTPAAPSVIVST